MKRVTFSISIVSLIIIATWHHVFAQNFDVSTSQKSAQEWAYTFDAPSGDWMQTDFDDSRWKRGPGGFGRSGTPGAVVRTNWHSKDIWLRRTFTIDKIPDSLVLNMHHDEDAQVYLNGKQISSVKGFVTRYKQFPLDDKATKLLKLGKNVLAIHCRQTVGGQYIDAGLQAGSKPVVGKFEKIPLDSPKAIQFFKADIKPILEENCFKCHGGKKKLRGGLNLTHRKGLLAGGDTKSAVDLKEPAKSLLLDMINYKDDHHQMPPYGQLPKKQIELLTKWVHMGSPYETGNDATAVAKKEESPLITEEAKNYWAYKKPVRPHVPIVNNKNWVRNPIDAFILARLEEKGISPAPELSRIKLVRRVYYDLIGLPPTPAQVQQFVNDQSPKAYENLISKLLSSPHYGEKWGRHWLDVVRYAETNGYEYDERKPNAWKYRDWVIDAFNKDKPYDRFLLEQLAGDELTDADNDTRIATIYYRLGIFDTHPVDSLQRDFDMYDDIVKTTSEAILGMTMGCARCHDHKKDPIPQSDYYSFLAFFRNIRPNWKDPVNEHGPTARPTHMLVRGNAHVKGKEVEPSFPAVLGFDDPQTGESHNDNTTGRRLALAKWIVHKDNPLTARVMMNRIWQHHFGRGIVPTPNDFGKLGAPPTHPKLLDWLAVEFIEQGWSIKEMHKLIMTSSAYRMSAKNDPEAMKVDPNNELFWRFNMRRLSAEEVRDSILAVDGTLERKIGGPSVYPELPIEVIRTSSKFDRKTGFIRDGFWQKPRPEYEVRRTVYTFLRRSLLPPMLSSLDLADTDSSCPVRFSTTVPTQALTMLNSKFMDDHAKLFANRLRKEAGEKTADQIRLGLHLVTQRPPTEKEIQLARTLIDDLRKEGMSEDQSLKMFCLMALNLNEFVYVD